MRIRMTESNLYLSHPTVKDLVFVRTSECINYLDTPLEDKGTTSLRTLST